MEPNKVKPAVIGGLVAGLLSTIPIINLLNFCCCAPVIGGGFLAAFLFNKDTGNRGLTPADGATLGAMAGGVAAAIRIVLGIPLDLILGPLTQEFIKSLGAPVQETGMAAGAVGAIVGGLIGAVVIAVFATIGGLIASQVYKPTGPVGGPPPGPYGGAPGAAPY